jgi:hypothetical protein
MVTHGFSGLHILKHDLTGADDRTIADFDALL